MPLTKNEIREVQLGIIHYLIRVGVTANADIVSILKPLTSHDKLRGVKRSLTVEAQTKRKKAKSVRKAAVPQKKEKTGKTEMTLVKAKVNTKTASNQPVNEVKINLDEARIHSYKEEIKRFCNRAAREQIKYNKMTLAEIEAGNREVYREPYRTLYHQFDMIIGALLSQRGQTLGDYGLGFKLDKNSINYLDRVAKAGFIVTLYNVAKALYGNN